MRPRHTHARSRWFRRSIVNFFYSHPSQFSPSLSLSLCLSPLVCHSLSIPQTRSLDLFPPYEEREGEGKARRPPDDNQAISRCARSAAERAFALKLAVVAAIGRVSLARSVARVFRSRSQSAFKARPCRIVCTLLVAFFHSISRLRFPSPCSFPSLASPIYLVLCVSLLLSASFSLSLRKRMYATHIRALNVRADEFPRPISAN